MPKWAVIWGASLPCGHSERGMELFRTEKEAKDLFSNIIDLKRKECLAYPAYIFIAQITESFFDDETIKEN